MSSESRSGARTVLDAALEQSRGAGTLDRDRILAEHPDLEDSLRDELHKLEVIAGARAHAETANLPGYTLLGEMRRGGQGVVYRAVQDGTGREVAIKVMHGGVFAAEGDRARFDLEVRILAALDHPSIVTIHDSGTASGQTWFVMDFVEGLPLDEYVRTHEPSIRDRLALMRSVCEAVHAAHLRGVIHRDLKPGNIRVGDGGVPKVLDFGLAKMTGPGLGGTTPVHTATGQFVGSLPWASPEQADGLSTAIDVRTDVYSLGVVLYQVLTGRFPYEVTGSVREVLERIAGAEPIRPSRHDRAIDDEVDTIVLTCLAKDPDRRYQGAGQLARDLDRYLADDAIRAKGDSTWYLVRKVIRRHRLALGVAAFFLVIVVASTVALGILYREAERQAETSERVLDGLGRLFQSLNPMHAGGDVTVREILDAGVADVIAELDDQPEAQARAMDFVADIYEGHGYYASAVPWRERVLALHRDELDASDVVVIERTCDLAEVTSNAASNAEEYARAERLYREALDLALTRAPENGRLIAACRSGLANVLQNGEEFVESEVLFREVLSYHQRTLGARHPVTANARAELAWLLQERGALDEAETLLRDTIEIRRGRPGVDDLQLAESLTQLASVLRRRSRFLEADPLYREALEIRRRRLGERHPLTADSLNSIGVLLKDLSRYDEAEPFYREAHAIRRETYGDVNPAVAVSLNNLANLYEVTGRAADAERLHREALAIRRTLFGASHLSVANSLHNLARLLEDTDPAEAERLFREALAIRRDHPGTPELAATLRELGGLLTAGERFDEAEPMILASLELIRTQDGETHRDVAAALNDLGILRARLGNHAGAVEAMSEALSIYRAIFGDEHSHVASTCANLATMLDQAGRADEAGPLFREALAIQRATLGAANTETAVTEVRFGTHLSRRGAFEEAETLLRHALEVFESSLGPDHARTRDTTRRLAELHEARGRPEGAGDDHRE